MTKINPVSQLRPNKTTLWLKHYLDDSNPKTFFNKTESARAAGYNCTSEDSFRAVGCQNFTKLSVKIREWLNEHGLDENALKIKIFKLLNAQETRFHTLRGRINADSLASNVNVIASASNGEITENLISVTIPALEVQRRTLDMAFKAQGLYFWGKQNEKNTGNVTLIMELTPED